MGPPEWEQKEEELSDRGNLLVIHKGQRQQPEAGSGRDIRALPFQRTKAMRLSLFTNYSSLGTSTTLQLSLLNKCLLSFLANLTDLCPFSEHLSLLVTSQPVVSCEPSTPHTTSLIFLPFTLHPRASVMTKEYEKQEWPGRS